MAKKKQIGIGPGVAIDLDKMMTGRLLVQATSGAGKSWLLRRMLEQSHGLCQQIVIDPEGEFSTLREKFDYVLAAKQGGDTLADVRTAKLLAERLLELGVSAILDIYELNPDQRVKFVRAFLEALVDAPKHLWHPVIVVLDEAHAFCPEKGSGEAESATAVKALCTRGRKRGFCAVLATQRLATLSKDAAAMCANKLIGRASLDTDITRCGAELGYGKTESRVLRDLDDGEFYAFGPAISKAVTKVKVGDVQTTHPQAGTQLAARVPPPTAKVKALLPKLSDLPAEAADRERTSAEMKKELAEAQRMLERMSKTIGDYQESARVQTVEKPALTERDRAALAALAEALRVNRAKAYEIAQTADDRLTTAVTKAVAEYLDITRKVGAEMATQVEVVLGRSGFQKILAKLEGLAAQAATSASSQPIQRQAVAAQPEVRRPSASSTRQVEPIDLGDRRVSVPQQVLLNSLAWLESVAIEQPRRGQLALVAKVSASSSGFEKNVSTLRTLGLVDFPIQGAVTLTPGGRALAVRPATPPTATELHESLIGRVSVPQGQLLRALIAAYPGQLSREDLAAKPSPPVSPSSSGFEKNVSTLRSLGLAEFPAKGFVKAAGVLFLEQVS